MSLQFSITLRDNMLDAIESTLGASAKINVFTGSVPANCATAEAGTLVAQFSLASDWSVNAAAGVKSLASLPLTTNAVGTGVAAHFRMYDSTNTTCSMQGTITAVGGGGDMTLDNTNIATSQVVNITAWTITAPGA